ncbi:pseudaminic acid cytidylyltransferase [Oscillospiraceae bacterium 38-13]
MRGGGAPCTDSLKIAVIPARGGSKRIPRKNIREFCGKPILAYSIEAAEGSGLFDEIMVSTDDTEIADVSKRYGNYIPFLRSAETADDDATITDVLTEVLKAYQKRGCVFSMLCYIYPTAPFVTADKLRRAYQMLEESGADALLPVTPFSYPPLRGLAVQENRIRMKWPENTFTRSQDLETIYHDCGQFGWIRTETLLRERNILCQNMIPMFLSGLEVQDIDSEIDWELAEQKYRLLREKGKL